MEILVTGYTGQLGYDVVNQGLQQGFKMVGANYKWRVSKLFRKTV